MNIFGGCANTSESLDIHEHEFSGCHDSSKSLLKSITITKLVDVLTLQIFLTHLNFLVDVLTLQLS